MRDPVVHCGLPGVSGLFRGRSSRRPARPRGWITRSRWEFLKLSRQSTNVRFVHRGIYESLLTDQLNQQLEQQDDLQAEYGTVDEAEQALAIARHLGPIIERAVRGAGAVEDRVALVRRILEVLPDTHAVGEAPYQVEPGKITRLDEVVSAGEP